MQTLSTLIQVNPGQDIPVGYLEAMLKAGATIWGCAIVNDGKIIANKSNNPTVQGITDVHEAFKDKDKVFHFSNVPEPVDPKSRQPFVVAVDEDGKPTIVAFIEGDYKSHTVKDGIATDEYYMFKEVLEPLVDQFYEATNQSVEGTMKLMTNTMQQKTLQAAAGERGTVILVANTGQMHTVSKNDQDAEFEWGDVTRHHDYGITDYPAKVEEPVAPKQMTPEEMMELAMGGNIEKAPITANKTVSSPAMQADKRIADKQKLTEEILAQQAKEDLAKISTAITPPNFVRMTVPTQSNSARKDFFQHTLKMPLPDDWKTRVYVDVPMSNVPAKFLPKLEQPATTKDVTPKVVTSDKTHPASGANGSVPPVAQAVIVPVIPLTQIKAFKETFLMSAEVKAVMTALGGKLPTEKELQDMEAKFPKWSAQTDTPLPAVCCFSHTAYTMLVREYPALAACLIGELAHNYLKNYKAPAVAQGTVTQDNRATGTGGSRRR